MPIRIKAARGSKDVYKKSRRQRIATACAISLILLIVSSLILFSVAILIQNQPSTSLVTYVPDTEDIIETPKPVKDISGNPNAPQPTMDITVSTSVSEVSLDAVDFNSEGLLDGMGTGGTGDGIGPGGLGGEGSGTGSGMGTKEKTNSAFVGQFWDLKKQKNGKDSPLKSGFASNQETLSLLSKFYNSNWSQSLLSSYFKSTVKLYTSSFYMPFCLDDEAANAYDPTKKMGLKRSRWVAVYTAKVQAPKSGRFRFVGLGDSVLAVRFNGKNVLATGMHTLENGVFYGAENAGYRKGKEFFEYASCQAWNSEEAGGENNLYGFMAGDVFNVERDQWYEMEVLVSEIGGGYFGFCLLIDDMDDPKKAKSEDGKPLFQLFRTTLVSPTAKDAYEGMAYPPQPDEGFVDPPYDPDSYVWRAKS